MADSGAAIGQARRGWRMVGAVALAIAAIPLLPLQPARAQVAGLGIAITPAFESPVTVGEQDQPALIQFINGSFGPQAAIDPVTLTNIRVNPACATSAVDPTGPSPCTLPEPRPNPALPVLELDTTSLAGTTCPGGPFIITGPDAEGDYSITPTSGPLTLAPIGQPGSSCQITFTFDVVQRPNDGATFQSVALLATSPTFPGGATQTGVSLVNVNAAVPVITTQVSATGQVTVGTTFTDTATVTGASNGPTPTGTVSFTVFADPPGAAPCSGTSTNLGPSPLSGPAPTPPTPPTAIATSSSVTGASPGTYRFLATYSGDVNYAPLGPTACNAPGENVTVAPFTTQIVTVATPTAKVFQPISDTATLTSVPGGPTRTGTVTFNLYGAGDATCAGPPTFTSTVPVVPGAVTSAPFTPTQPGTYRWIAIYSGDANYLPAIGACNDPNEISVITIIDAPPADFDGDGKTDISVVRPSSSFWFIRNSSGGERIGAYGTNGDIPVPADYDGDGKVDLAVYRPATSTWFIDLSSAGDLIGNYGINGDIPVPADYDGDGKDDIAVFRPSSGTWFVRQSSGGDTVSTFGVNGDVPVPGDYDGDGRDDLAVYRPFSSTWFIHPSGGGPDVAAGYGLIGDVPVPGDYDGDGKTDIAVFRPLIGAWFIHLSSTNADIGTTYGQAGDIPSPGDYDGDGKTDLATFRPSTGGWSIRLSSGAPDIVGAYGITGDIPLPLPAAIRRAFFS